MGYLKLANPEARPHRCRPPGWWRCWRDGVKTGAVWACDCGEKFEYLPHKIVYRRGIYQVGQDMAPWWPIWEHKLPPPLAKLLRGENQR